MRGVVLAALAALSAGACATAPVETESEAPDAGAPRPTPGYDWHLSEADGSARLAYGVETSDDLKLALDCQGAGGKVEITALAEAPSDVIHLESGGDTERYPARSEPSMVGDGSLLTAAAASGDPVFQRFRRLGWLAQWHGPTREVYAPQPGSKDRIDRFFAACG